MTRRLTERIERLREEVANEGGLSPGEFAAATGVDQKTVYRWIRMKFIIAFCRNKRWSIPKSQIEETLRSNTVP